MLAGFIVVRALAPAALPAFLLLVALGLHGFWVGALAARFAGRRRKGG
jgi:hypothetical protein